MRGSERRWRGSTAGTRKKLTEADLWDSEESARRGFACPREWKERLTSTEYERIKAISRKWLTGDDRRDAGIQRAAVFIGSSMAPLNGYDTRNLFPNPPPEREQTEQEQIDALGMLGGAIDRQWRSQSEP